jgi:hypothetical protein
MATTSSHNRSEIRIDDGEPIAGRLEIETEVITYESITTTKPDMGWTMVDHLGHFHAYATDGELPTLIGRTRHVDCPGGCGLDDEECEGYDVTDWFCRICDQPVEPKRLPDPGPHSMPGRSMWSVVAQGDREITGEVTVRIGPDLFGVARAHTERMDGDGHSCVVTTRLDGISALGKR